MVRVGKSKSVYGAVAAAMAVVVALGAGLAARPAAAADETVLDAREAFRKRDRGRLAAYRAIAAAERHPLEAWIEYWEMSLRISELHPDEAAAFYARWPNSYVEDRFRNDWLLELGRRRDWANFAVDYPLFRMNDDREVSCYAVLVDYLAGKDARAAGMNAWLAQREADEGCATMAATLFDGRQLTPDDAWRKVRYAIEANKPRAAQQAAQLLGAAAPLQELLDDPVRYLHRKASAATRHGAELATLAIMRAAANNTDVAASFADRWERQLPSDLAGWAWAAIGKHAALKLQVDATDHYERAAQWALAAAPRIDWPDETLAWQARAALRATQTGGRPAARWSQVLLAVGAMSPAEQQDGAWAYWKARALHALASSGDPRHAPAAESMRTESRGLLEALSRQLSFYGKLASEDLGRPPPLPAAPAPLTAAERAAAQRHAGLARAMRLIAIGLRGEGVREWNFSLRGMTDRELLAAAQWACDREVWDRCINTSDRTRSEIDLAQRFPMPFRSAVVARAREINLDPAYVYGLIRQESRFIMDARSSAGASGLMQLMPETARWTARRIGLPYSGELITDRDMNIVLGTNYLKLVLDDFGGSQAMGAAAYNAGPGRPRRWREGPTLDPAIWAENIPFNETRDYVKKVLSNAVYYAARLGTPTPTLKARLGQAIGPRGIEAAAVNRELP